MTGLSDINASAAHMKPFMEMSLAFKWFKMSESWNHSIELSQKKKCVRTNNMGQVKARITGPGIPPLYIAEMYIVTYN